VGGGEGEVRIIIWVSSTAVFTWMVWVRTIPFSERLHARGRSIFWGLSWRRRCVARLFQIFIGLVILVIWLVHGHNLSPRIRVHSNWGFFSCGCLGSQITTVTVIYQAIIGKVQKTNFEFKKFQERLFRVCSLSEHKHAYRYTEETLLPNRYGTYGHRRSLWRRCKPIAAMPPVTREQPLGPHHWRTCYNLRTRWKLEAQ
jgi:hypothetical protein